jgi:hypothetical protein
MGSKNRFCGDATDADFIDPPAEWQPPYPDRWEQVLFDRQRLEDPKRDNNPARKHI